MASSSNASPRPASLDAINTVQEVAGFAKVSTRTVMRAIAGGQLKVLRAGAQIRIREEAVWEWLELCAANAVTN